jgi:hypothetical protein
MTDTAAALLHPPPCRLHAWLSCIMQRTTGNGRCAAVFLYPSFGLTVPH